VHVHQNDLFYLAFACTVDGNKCAQLFDDGVKKLRASATAGTAARSPFQNDGFVEGAPLCAPFRRLPHEEVSRAGAQEFAGGGKEFGVGWTEVIGGFCVGRQRMVGLDRVAAHADELGRELT